MNIISAVVTILLFFLMFNSYNILNLRLIIKKEINLAANIISENAITALLWNDNKLANETVDSIKLKESIIQACIFKKDYSILASLKNIGDVKCTKSNTSSYNNFTIVHKLKKNNNILGYLSISANFDDAKRSLPMYLFYTLLLMIPIFFILLFISSKFQKPIVKPIIDLTEILKKIIMKGTYNSRLENKYFAEVGILAKSFNQMLDEIEERDTKLKKLNNNLQEQANELKGELDRRTDFVGYLSHEVITPSTIICDGISILKDLWDTLPDEIKKDQINDVYINTERLRTLIKELTDISMLKSNQTKFNMEPTDVNDLCKNVIKECQHMIKVKNKDLSIKLLQSSISTKLVCDSSKMQQVIRNILNNSIRYSESGQIKVKFSLHKKGTKKMLKISISDEGVGIPEKELKAIFNLFYQSSRTKSKAGGKGSGLQLCERVIEAHKGKIWAENNKTKGSTFHIILPRELKQGSYTF